MRSFSFGSFILDAFRMALTFGGSVEAYEGVEGQSCFTLALLIIHLRVVLGISRQQAQEWCIKHGFELVELNPEELPEEDGECCCLGEAECLCG